MKENQVMILHVPTQLNEKQIEEFQELFRRYFDEDISRDEAEVEALEFIRFVALIIRND